MRQTGLPLLLVQDTVLEAAGRFLGELVGHLVSHDTRVGRDPNNEDRIASGHQACADLNGCPCPMLAWSDCVGPNPLDRCLGVRKDGEAVADSWSLLKDLQRLVNGKDLGVKDLKAAVCAILYLYSATCGQKGHGSGGFLHDHILPQTEMIGPSRAPQSPYPH